MNNKTKPFTLPANPPYTRQAAEDVRNPVKPVTRQPQPQAARSFPEEGIPLSEGSTGSLTGQALRDLLPVEAVPVAPDAPTVEALTRAEFERLLGGEFENVPNEAGRRANDKLALAGFETYSDGEDCFCYKLPKDANPVIKGHTWSEVARIMEVKGNGKG